MQETKGPYSNAPVNPKAGKARCKTQHQWHRGSELASGGESGDYTGITKSPPDLTGSDPRCILEANTLGGGNQVVPKDAFKWPSPQLPSLPGLEVGFILGRLRFVGRLNEHQASIAIVGLFARDVSLGLSPYANLLGQGLDRWEQGTSDTHLAGIRARTARASDSTQ